MDFNEEKTVSWNKDKNNPSQKKTHEIMNIKRRLEESKDLRMKLHHQAQFED
jgi:hypothetical protein